MEKVIEWIFSTKAGRFVFITVFTAIVAGIMTQFIDLHFWIIVLGGAVSAAFLSVFDDNKKWY